MIILATSRLPAHRPMGVDWENISILLLLIGMAVAGIFLFRAGLAIGLTWKIIVGAILWGIPALVFVCMLFALIALAFVGGPC